jgi:ABC-2 type transport system permease protein
MGNVLVAEFRRSFRLAWAYSLENVADFVLYFAGFLLLVVVFQASSENYGAPGILGSLIGYITWKVCATCSIDVAGIADEESKTGTLEQIFLSGRSALQIFLARSLAYFLNEIGRGLLLGLALGIVLNTVPAPGLLTLLIFGLTFLGALGMGLGLGGLVLVYKRLGGFLNLVWQLLVFFTGALAPQAGLFGSFTHLLPLSLGIDALRGNLVDGLSFGDLWTNGLLPGLLVNTIAYLVLGVILFNWGERKARLLGVLGHY